MNYGRLATQEVSNALFLKRFGVSFWVLAYVYGEKSNVLVSSVYLFGRDSILRTTVHKAENIPQDLLADEVSLLEGAYPVFKSEAHALSPKYPTLNRKLIFRPLLTTVNTDG